MMTEYINSQDYLTIVIDGNGDNYESFEKSVDFIRANYSVEEKKYYSGFFDDALFYFNHHGIPFKIIFSGFMGTEIHISKNESNDHKDIFRRISKHLIELISNNPA